MTNRAQMGEGYARHIMRTAFSGWGARIGFAWVCLLVFVACFAPLLANSMPLLVSQQGEISSPILRYLSAEDIALMVLFIVGVLLWKLPIRFSKKVLLLLATVAVSYVVALFFFSPPITVVYEQFREQAAAGAYEWQVLPPIPYSPSDYLRDFGDTSLTAPILEGGRFHLMGTDSTGSDVASRMVHASRVALSIGFIATGISMFIGIIIGGADGVLLWSLRYDWYAVGGDF